MQPCPRVVPFELSCRGSFLMGLMASCEPRVSHSSLECSSTEEGNIEEQHWLPSLNSRFSSGRPTLGPLHWLLGLPPSPCPHTSTVLPFT